MNSSFGTLGPTGVRDILAVRMVKYERYSPKIMYVQRLCKSTIDTTSECHRL